MWSLKPFIFYLSHTDNIPAITADYCRLISLQRYGNFTMQTNFLMQKVAIFCFLLSQINVCLGTQSFSYCVICRNRHEKRLFTNIFFGKCL